MMVLVHLVDLPCIFRSFQKALRHACHSKVLLCKLLSVAPS